MSELRELLANAKGDRSIDDIAGTAKAAGHQISRSVVAKYLQGKGGTNPPEATLQAFAAGFGVDVRLLRAAVGRQTGELGPWTPTPRSASLTKAQREALDRLIVTIVEQGGQSDAGTAEDQKSPGGGGATRIHPRRHVIDSGALPMDKAAESHENHDGQL